MQKRNKKGFTLAELLIVVAIIAVLVAIAVPLFVGALDKAEDAVLQANERTLKGMAVTEILTSKEKDYLYSEAEDGGTQKANKYWAVKGKYTSESDTFSIESINGNDTALEKGGESVKTKTGYDLYVLITYSDLTVTS